MRRRVLIAGAIILTLLAGVRLLNRGMHPALAGHASADRPLVSTRPDPSPAATEAAPSSSDSRAEEKSKSVPMKSASEFRNTASEVPAQLSVAGVTDIDPHKAFGSKSAPVVMEVFSDYQCPACKTLFLTTHRQLMDNYVSNGKVYLIHRDFPLPAHAHSRVAARYARAAAQIGKVEAAEQALFQNQEKWEQTGDVDGIVAAALSSAEMTKVRNLVKGGTLEPLIEKDHSLGMAYHVNQTPTTVFHSKGQTYPYAGVMSYEILRQFLDQLLAQR